MTVRILHADDEPDFRDLVAFVLVHGGFDVIEASNGQEAVELALSEKPDLILLDIRMPKMSGYEAYRQLKAIDETRHTPVVFLSARGQPMEIQQGLDAGADEYILKPFGPEELVNKLRDVLRRRELGIY